MSRLCCKVPLCTLVSRFCARWIHARFKVSCHPYFFYRKGVLLHGSQVWLPVWGYAAGSLLGSDPYNKIVKRLCILYIQTITVQGTKTLQSKERQVPVHAVLCACLQLTSYCPSHRLSTTTSTLPHLLFSLHAPPCMVTEFQELNEVWYSFTLGCAPCRNAGWRAGRGSWRTP